MSTAPSAGRATPWPVAWMATRKPPARAKRTASTMSVGALGDDQDGGVVLEQHVPCGARRGVVGVVLGEHGTLHAAAQVGDGVVEGDGQIEDGHCGLRCSLFSG